PLLRQRPPPRSTLLPYTALVRTATVKAGDLTTTISVNTSDDHVYGTVEGQASDSYTVTLANNQSAAVAVTDAETQPTFTIAADHGPTTPRPPPTFPPPPSPHSPP